MTSQGDIRVSFHGRPTGFGGYSQATRYIAKAFSESSIPVRFESKAAFFKDISRYSGPCNVDFYIHTPPFSKHKSMNYKIGYFFWETDCLPKDWGRDIRATLDEIWVPCDLTKKACRKAGFRGPIEIVHTPRPVEAEVEPIAIPLKGSDKLCVGEGTFIFYSIFQWNERKGYRQLFRAYYEEFSEKDNVLMVIKTNPIKHRDHGLPKIKHDLLSLKRYCTNRRIPPVFLTTETLSNKQVAGLHDLGNCFVLPHHGEGWGMPIHDAMMHDSLIITTPYGGITEHLNSSNALLIKHKVVNVKPMTWCPYYTSNQMWAEPDVGHLKSLMRGAYNNRAEESAALTARARRTAESMDIKAFSKSIENLFSQKRFLKVFGG
jgi:glycosyltransferase involved in cell wall biosynthesis